MADNWIGGAINPAHKGQFAAKAAHAGKSTAEYAKEEKHAGGKLGKQAVLASTLMRMPRHADGAVVSPEPSKYPRLFDFLFGHKALDAASKVGDKPPQTPPQNQTAPQDTSAVREAARQAAERMDAAKKANNGVTPKEFCEGGMVRPGNYGR